MINWPGSPLHLCILATPKLVGKTTDGPKGQWIKIWLFCQGLSTFSVNVIPSHDSHMMVTCMGSLVPASTQCRLFSRINDCWMHSPSHKIIFYTAFAPHNTNHDLQDKVYHTIYRWVAGHLTLLASRHMLQLTPLEVSWWSTAGPKGMTAGMCKRAEVR